jgi:hypothetical protein
VLKILSYCEKTHYFKEHYETSNSLKISDLPLWSHLLKLTSHSSNLWSMKFTVAKHTWIVA